MGLNKKCIQARLVGAQKALSHQPSTFLMQLEQHLIHQNNIILYREQLLWQMKSRIFWLSYGDANTKFFHVQTKMKKARQHIIALKNEDNVWVQGTTLYTLILNTFKSIYQSSSSSQPSPPHSFYSSSDFNTQNFLNTLLDFPSIDEIRATLWNMHPLKSRGPDGFHVQFFQSNWNSLRTDVAKFIQTIFITTPIPEDLTQI